MNNFLHFSRTERIGIVLLASLALILLLGVRFLPDRSQYNPTDFSELAAQLASAKIGTETVNATAEIVPSRPQELVDLAPFDPNTATNEQLQAVGLSAKSSRAWTSYVRKGGSFNNWAAVENFRALSTSERQQLRPYLQFPAQAEGERADTNKPDFADLSIPITPTPFDPNTVELADLLAMGVPEKSANNWQRYLASGARFRKVEDIAKIYDLPAEVAEQLIPFATITESTTPVPIAALSSSDAIPTAFDAPDPNVRVDVNQATAEEWQQLRGIGPGYSRRIIEYRDKLGGFVAVEQVAETYGLPDSVFQAIYLQLRPSSILRQLAINQLGVSELANHPYLSYANARAIVQYREEHGPYQNAEVLGKLYGLSEKVKKNIFPYLSFE